MKSIVVTETRTRQILELRHDTGTREYLINSVAVVRQADLESSPDEYVFAERGSEAPKLYHIGAAAFQRLLQLTR